MSVIPLKADIRKRGLYVRLLPTAGRGRRDEVATSGLQQRCRL